MNKTEIGPNEQMHTSGVPLNLDTDQRLNLVHELRSLSDELEEGLLITPDKTKKALKGIALHSREKGSTPIYMELETTHSLYAPNTASISLSGNQAMHIEPRTFSHRPTLDVWEEWRPGMTEPYRMLGNVGLVGVLAPLVPTGTLESFMDINPTGREVVDVLASRLYKKARTRMEFAQYSAHDIMVGGSEFSRDTDFIVHSINDRIIRSLYIAASFMLDDNGFVRKTYGYEAVDNRQGLKSANGTVHMSATSAVSKTRLDAFAQRDQLREDPLLAFHVAINDIRKKYLS